MKDGVMYIFMGKICTLSIDEDMNIQVNGVNGDFQPFLEPCALPANAIYSRELKYSERNINASLYKDNSTASPTQFLVVKISYLKGNLENSLTYSDGGGGFMGGGGDDDGDGPWGGVDNAGGRYQIQRLSNEPRFKALVHCAENINPLVLELQKNDVKVGKYLGVDTSDEWEVFVKKEEQFGDLGMTHIFKLSECRLKIDVYARYVNVDLIDLIHDKIYTFRFRSVRLVPSKRMAESPARAPPAGAAGTYIDLTGDD